MVILDAGHGGVIGGAYQTPGKRSPAWAQGVLYEGMFNRWVVNRLIERLDRAGVPYAHVSPELEDTPLAERVRRANALAAKHPVSFLLSVHANAGGGTGLEVFTSKGQTGSDAIAETVIDQLVASCPGHRLRADTTDGDRDREADFYVLRETKCPAVLVEVAFMDSEADYAKLWDEGFLAGVVEGLFRAIRAVGRG